LYYYYGVHKEKKFDEYYMGSPVTHKWCWDFYTPKKQILEIFPYTDEDWLEANNIERRIIKPFLNNNLCLNEGCAGVFSFKIASDSGKMGGQKTYEMKVGVHGRNEEQRKIDAKKGGDIGGKLVVKLGLGIHGRTKEERKIDAKKGGDIGGKLVVKLGLGIHALSKEQRIEIGSRSAKKTNAQKWECTETGYVANPGNLTQYQKRKGIDTSKRKRIS